MLSAAGSVRTPASRGLPAPSDTARLRAKATKRRRRRTGRGLQERRRGRSPAGCPGPRRSRSPPAARAGPGRGSWPGADPSTLQAGPGRSAGPPRAPPPAPRHRPHAPRPPTGFGSKARVSRQLRCLCGTVAAQARPPGAPLGLLGWQAATACYVSRWARNAQALGAARAVAESSRKLPRARRLPATQHRRRS